MAMGIEKTIGSYAKVYRKALVEGKTKTWIIPGTEDMMPYIYGKTLIVKWVSTVIGFPILAILIAWVVSKL